MLKTVCNAVASAPCDLFRETVGRVPGVCSVSKLVSEVACAPNNFLGNKTCDAVSALQQFFANTPFADVTLTFSVNDLPVNGSMQFRNVTADLSSISASVAASASGTLAFSIKYQRRVPTDAVVAAALGVPGLALGVCTLNWSGDYSVAASSSVSRNVELALTSETNDVGDLVLHFADEREWTASFDFSPSPIAKLVTTTPQMILNCPLATVAGAVFGVGERLFSGPDVRKVWPLITGEGFPLRIHGIHLTLKIPVLHITDANTASSMSLAPHIQARGIYYTEVTRR